MSGRLDGRRAVVVGASSGIGRALAVASVRAGADTLLVARRRAPLEEAVAEAGGGSAVVADITEEADVARLADEAVAGGAVDLMVVAAASGLLVRMADAGADQWASLLGANVVAVNQLIGAMVPVMAPAGVVAALSSETVGRARMALGLYGASKAALDQSLLSWQEEHPGLRFCRVTMGATMPTGFGDRFEPDLLGQAMAHWVRGGEMQRRFMPAVQVAEVLLGTLAAALDNPDVNIEQLRLRSPSARVGSMEEIEFT